MQEIYKQNRGLLFKLARRYVGIDNAVSLDDLVQAGFLGLCDAAGDWDPGRGAWSTIAYFHVRRAMREAVGLHGTRRRAHRGAVSLDEPLPGEEGTSRLDLLADESIPDPDDAIERDERCGAVRAAVGRLTPDRGKVVQLHDLEGQTYERIAERMGIAKQCARSLRSSALKDLGRDWKLKKALDDETRFHAHKGVTAFLSDWTSVTEEAAMWRIECIGEGSKSNENQY